MSAEPATANTRHLIRALAILAGAQYTSALIAAGHTDTHGNRLTMADVLRAADLFNTWIHHVPGQEGGQ